MAINQRTLTTGEVAGSGIFDELMRTVKAHVHAELKDGRINGESYTQLYLGALQNVLQVATQYSLQYETTNKQLLLLDEQLVQAKLQGDILVAQKKQLAVDLQMAEYNRDTMLPQQFALLGAQTTQVTTQVTLADKQILQVVAQTSQVGKQEDLVDEQIKSAQDQTTLPTAGTNLAAYNKTLAETEILTQKAITETAQTEGSFIGDTTAPTGTDTIGGLVGIEMKLKNVQKESFLRDAEQKAAKMYTDVFATLYATDPNDAYAAPENYGFDITTARNVMDKLLAGVDAARAPDNTIATGVELPTVGTGTGATLAYPRDLTSDAAV